MGGHVHLQFAEHCASLVSVYSTHPHSEEGYLMAAVKFTLNGKPQTVDVAPAMPLLWVLRDTLGMTGTKFGCGMALCGACTVHIDGQPVRSCVTPISSVAGKKVTTIEGLSPDRSAPDPAGLDRGRRAAVRLLPVRADHDRGGAAGQDGEPHRRRYRRGHAQQHLPLRNLSADPQGGPSCRRTEARREVRNERRQSNLSRRGFLRQRPRGLLRSASSCPATRAAPKRPRASKLNAFVHVGTDDVVTLFIHKAEMGQGTVTSLSMLLAEELECDWKKIRTEFPRRSSREYGRMQGVFGSAEHSHVVRFAAQRRRRGARDADCRPRRSSGASTRAHCRAENSTVINTATGRALTYGSLAEAASKLHAAGQVPR